MTSHERTYRVREFAALAGVSVKALRHYDRLGLLQPARTGAGHRLYTNADRVRLHRIASLQFVGIPLKGVKQLLDADTASLALVRERRSAFHERRRLLDHAIHALSEIEVANADPVSAQRLVIEASWAKAEAEHEAREREGTDIPYRVTERKRVLFRDAAALRQSDPDSAAAQAIVHRWRAILTDETGGDPETQTETARFFNERHKWPLGLKRYVGRLYEMDPGTWQEVADFIERAEAASADLL